MVKAFINKKLIVIGSTIAITIFIIFIVFMLFSHNVNSLNKTKKEVVNEEPIPVPSSVNIEMDLTTTLANQMSTTLIILYTLTVVVLIVGTFFRRSLL